MKGERREEETELSEASGQMWECQRKMKQALSTVTSLSLRLCADTFSKWPHTLINRPFQIKERESEHPRNQNG